MFRYVLIALLGFLWFLAVLITQYFYRLFFSSGNIYNCLYSPLFTSVTVMNFTYKVGRKKSTVFRCSFFVFVFFCQPTKKSFTYLLVKKINTRISLLDFPH